MTLSVWMELRKLEAARITMNITVNFFSQTKVSHSEDGKIAVVVMRRSDIVTPDEHCVFVSDRSTI